MSTANEQPGSGLPEERGESGEPVESGALGELGEVASVAEATDVADVAEDADTIDTIDTIEAVETIEEAGGAEPDDDPEPAAGAEATETTKTAETEEERIAREQIEFDKLVAAFHSESAPDPQPRRPGPGGPGAGPGATGPHKIIRYPVLDPRPEWEGGIVEPTDETTSDPLDYIEHYEPPDPDLPQASAATLASWTMLVGGVAFLVLHTLLGWQTPEYLGWLAIIGVFGGIVTLVARMKPDRDEYDDPDNGAVV